MSITYGVKSINNQLPDQMGNINTFSSTQSYIENIEKKLNNLECNFSWGNKPSESRNSLLISRIMKLYVTFKDKSLLKDFNFVKIEIERYRGKMNKRTTFRSGLGGFLPKYSPSGFKLRRDDLVNTSESNRPYELLIFDNYNIWNDLDNINYKKELEIVQESYFNIILDNNNLKVKSKGFRKGNNKNAKVYLRFRIIVESNGLIIKSKPIGTIKLLCNIIENIAIISYKLC